MERASYAQRVEMAHAVLAAVHERLETGGFGDRTAALLTAAEHHPAVLAEVVHRALTARRPRPVYSVHPGRSRVLLERLPTRLADAAITTVLRRAAR